MKIKNIGEEIKTASDVWKIALVTNAGKSYGEAYTIDLVYIPPWNITESIRKNAVLYEELDLLTPVAPNTTIEGDILFQIPSNEKPERLYFKVGIIGGYEVNINLKP